MKTKLLLLGNLLCITFICNAQCWDKISSNYSHTMAIKTNGEIWGWGNNTYAQLGNSSNVANITPALVWEGNNWSKIFVSPQHSAAIRNDGTLWTCGNNSYGQIGDGTTNQAWLPTQVGTATDWSTLSLGSVFCLGLKTNGTLWGWGNNTNAGSLGNNSTANFLSPVQIGTDNDWVKIQSAQGHTLAIKSNGTLWGWGYNGFGALGDGTTTNRMIPTQIGSANNWVDIFVGNDYSFAKKADGSVYACGKNDYSNLGNQSFTQINTLTLMANLSDFISFSCGNTHVLAIKNDGTLWAWGKNGEGQLGLGTNTIYQGEPMQVGTANNWTKVMAGYNHSFAINSNNQLYAWGENNYVQLGTTDGLSRNVPTLITCGALNTEENEIVKTKFYPNPTNGIINFTNEVTYLKLSTLDGKSIQIKPQNNQIDISNLQKGIYIINGKDINGNYFSDKLIKN